MVELIPKGSSTVVRYEDRRDFIHLVRKARLEESKEQVVPSTSAGVLQGDPAAVASPPGTCGVGGCESVSPKPAPGGRFLPASHAQDVHEPWGPPLGSAVPAPSALAGCPGLRPAAVTWDPSCASSRSQPCVPGCSVWCPSLCWTCSPGSSWKRRSAGTTRSRQPNFRRSVSARASPKLLPAPSVGRDPSQQCLSCAYLLPRTESLVAAKPTSPHSGPCGLCPQQAEANGQPANQDTHFSIRLCAGCRPLLGCRGLPRAHRERRVSSSPASTLGSHRRAGWTCPMLICFAGSF